MKLEDMTIQHEGIEWQKCLQHWNWLLKENPEFNIWIVTKFGEIFVLNDDEEVWFISTAGSSYEKIANSKEEFFEFIDEQKNVDFYFMPDVIQALEANNMFLEEKECYGFRVPMVFMESTLEPDNFKIIIVENYLTGLGDLLSELQGTNNGEKILFKVVS